MKLYHKAIIHFVFLCWVTNIFGQSLSYNEAINIMIQNNKKLKSLDYQLKSADYSRKSTWSYRMPHIKLTGLAVHLNEDVTMDLGDLGTALNTLAQLGSSSSSLAANSATLASASANASGYTDIASGYSQIASGYSTVGSYYDALNTELGKTNWEHYTIQEQNFWTIDANLTYPLFTGGKINAAIKIGNIEKKITELEVSKEQNTLFTELTSRYFQLRLASEAVEVRQQALSATEQHLENAKKLEQNGMGASIETMQAEMAVADAKRELLSAQKDKLLAQTALEGTMGVDTVSSDLVTSLFVSDKLQDLSFYIDEAQQYYPDINKLFMVQEMVHQGVKAKRADYIPDVAFNGMYNVLSDNVSESVPDWFVGIGFSWSVFDGLKHRNEVREMKAKEQSVIYMKEQAMEDIGILVRKYYQELDKHQALVSSLQKDEAFAEELLRVREKAFNEGMGTSTDVVDATLYLSSIRLKRLKALYDYDVTLASLLEVCGKSTEFTSYLN